MSYHLDTITGVPCSSSCPLRVLSPCQAHMEPPASAPRANVGPPTSAPSAHMGPPASGSGAHMGSPTSATQLHVGLTASGPGPEVDTVCKVLCFVLPFLSGIHKFCSKFSFEDRHVWAGVILAGFSESRRSLLRVPPSFRGTVLIAVDLSITPEQMVV